MTMTETPIPSAETETGAIHHRLLTMLGGRTTRKVANNSYVTDHGDFIAYRLHSTDVVRAYRDGSVILNTGGWQTVTTKDRMNRVIGPVFRIWQTKGEWWIQGRMVQPTYFWDGMDLTGI